MSRDLMEVRVKVISKSRRFREKEKQTNKKSQQIIE